jgi:raffinose/stachyose/melibiose transport system substrate-binding protein
VEPIETPSQFPPSHSHRATAARTSGLPESLSRRSLLKAAALGAVAASPLAACGSGGGNGATTVRFYQSKPEVIGYFDDIVKTFNKSQSKVRVVHESTGSLVATFVRHEPHDLVLNNYTLDAGIFVNRGVLTDLKDVPAIKRIDPSVQALVGQYATPESATDVIPYSITAAGVIYNKTLFQQQGQAVPTTWAEFLKVCQAFKAKGITPVFGTYKDTWTISQGLFDYVSGSMIDIADFFTKLKAQGTDVGPDSPVSFERTFAPAVDKMLEIAGFTNGDAGSRAYADGNAAFAKGAAAMYLQGPWGIGEVATANPKTKVGTFALPATDKAQDSKARVNLDLALWIPKGARQPEAARTFMDYLLTPGVMNKYNLDNLAYTPVKNAPPVKDERIAGLEPYIRDARFYQGAGTYIPQVIPLGNYLQDLVLTRNGTAFVRKLDKDWRRLAQRTV